MIFIMKKINTISRCAVAHRNDKLNDKTLTPLYHSYVLVISRRPGITQDELAIKLGKSRSAITNTLGLLRLPDEVQNLIYVLYPYRMQHRLRLYF